MSDIEIRSSAKSPAEEQTSAGKQKKVVTWQFRKRSYQQLTSITDKLADKTRTGNDRKMVIKARNWRIDLDLDNAEDKKMHEYLLNHNENGEYWLLADKSKNDKVSEEGATLQKLMEMSIPQLMNCITDEELRSVGIMSQYADKYQLVAAIMRKKKLA